MTGLEILEKLFYAISADPITFNKLCRSSKLHPRTVRSYLKIVEFIQKQERVVVERRDFRVVIKKG